MTSQRGSGTTEGRGEPGQDDLLYFLLRDCGHQGGGEGCDLVGALTLSTQRVRRSASARLPLGVVADHSEDPLRAAKPQNDPTGPADEKVPATALGKEPQPDPGGPGGRRTHEPPQSPAVIGVDSPNHLGQRHGGLREQRRQGGCATQPLQLALLG